MFAQPPGRSLRLATLTIWIACFAVVGLDRSGVLPFLHPAALRLYGWVLLLGGAALLLGLANVIWIHLRRIQRGDRDWTHSLALVAAAAAVLAAGLLSEEGAQSPLVEWIFDSILAPGQAMLFALLAFFMAAAAYRLLRFNRRGGIWMLAGLLLMLLVQTPAANVLLPEAVRNAGVWLLEEPVMGALRGALLGGSLALALVGVRALLGRS